MISFIVKRKATLEGDVNRAETDHILSAITRTSNASDTPAADPEKSGMRRSGVTMVHKRHLHLML